MGKFGIDISNHNGDIDWGKLSKEVSFVIIRAGYGQNNIDLRAIKNIENATKYGVPFGLYWFSYALNTEMSAKEANYLCNLADKYKPTYPLCYDWEYDSDNYAKKNKADTSKQAMLNRARVFLETVKSRGYYPMIYTNIDYLNRGFGELTNQYDVWLAQWGVNSPSVSCGIWQTTDKGVIKGINGNVDKDIAYKDYPSIINKNENATPIANYKLTDKLKDKIEKNVSELFWETYTDVANDIINGKYGVGKERKQKLEELGYNYDVAQIFVNAFLGY